MNLQAINRQRQVYNSKSFMQEDPNPKSSSTFPLFSKHLILQPNSAIQFANQSRKQFQDFIEAFRKRIVVETEYANSLMTVSRSLDKYIERTSDKTVSFICSAFQVENEQRAHQARQLADSLKTQIYEICLNLSKEENTVIKKAERDVKNLIRRYESVSQNVKLSEMSYEKSSEKYDQHVITKSYLTHTSTLPHQKKSKLLSKTTSSINDHKQVQRHYISTHKQYNEFTQEYNKIVGENLNQVQKQIRQHIALEADCLRKLIVAEVSMFKNIQYDLINISKQMEKLDMQKDLQIACNEAQMHEQHLVVDQNGPDATSIKDKRKSASFVQTESTEPQLKPKSTELTKGMMATSIQNIEQDHFTELILHKKSKPFNELIQLRWNQLTSKLQTEKIEHKQNLNQVFQQYLSTSQSCQELISSRKQEDKNQVKNQIYDNFAIITRYIYEVWNGSNITAIGSKKKTKSNEPAIESSLNFIKKLFSASHFYRLVAYSFIECFRTHHIVLIDTQQKVQEIAKFLNVLLTKSYKENDVFILRGLLFLLFTFYYIQNNTKRHMASEPSVYKNYLWKKPDFWDAAIFESTYQEMLNFNHQNTESHQQNAIIEKNLLFSQLAMFSHYMIMLGISSQNVRQIVGRFCKLYSMTEQQNRDLSKMITNTVKQYKEIILVNLKNNNKGEKTQKEQLKQNTQNHSSNGPKDQAKQ